MKDDFTETLIVVLIAFFGALFLGFLIGQHNFENQVKKERVLYINDNAYQCRRIK